jgi:glycosyltransferase involved in cell wall biosynthesis
MLRKRSRQWHLSSTSLIVAVSRELADLLVEGGITPSKIMLVPNGVDATLFKPEGTCCRVAPEDSIVIGFVGGLRPWHGIQVLADAFRILALDPRFHLLVIGNGPMALHIENLQSEFGERIRLTGAIPHQDIPAYLRGIDIAVAPYPEMEGFYFSPLKVQEYLATGRAVIASRIGQLRNTIRDGENGVLVPPGDAEALAQAIRILADDAGIRRRIGNNAANDVRTSHTWEHKANTIIERIQGLLQMAHSTGG